MESLLDASVAEILATGVERVLAKGDAMVGVGCEALDRDGEVVYAFDDFGDAVVLASPCYS